MKSFAAIFLAFQILLSSLSFNMGFHYCGGKMVNASLFGKAAGCEHAQRQGTKPCPLHKTPGNGISQKGCCQDATIFVQGQGHPTNSLDASLELKPHPVFAAAFVAAFIQPLFSQAAFVPKFQFYSPPLIERDMPVLLQSFRC